MPVVKAPLAHAQFDQFPVRDSNLYVAGRDLSTLANIVGQTPFYIYERQALAQRVTKLRQVLPKEVALHYAVKANPFAPLVQYMVGMVDGLDIASGGELSVALNAGASPKQISFAGPGKSLVDLTRAVSAGVLIHVESERELTELARLSNQLGVAARIALRINPDFELKSSGMRMGGGAKPFGIDAARIPEVLAMIHHMGLPFEGFHLYAGSQNLHAASLCEAQERSLNLILDLLRQAPPSLQAQVRHVNIGGGFGVPYFPGEQHLDLEPIAQHLARLSDRLADHFPQAKLEIELGRYLVAEAGLYVCRVIDKKVSAGQIFLITDGGMHHHLAASGNFGQVLRKNYPVVIANRMQSEAVELVSIVGPLCTPLDLLADKIELPQAEIGDLVAIYLSGAYGASASPQAFLGHPAAVELLL